MPPTPIDSKPPSVLPIAALVALAVLLPFDRSLFRLPLPWELGGDLHITLVEIAAAFVVLAGCARWLVRRAAPEEAARSPIPSSPLTWTALALVATVFLTAIWSGGDPGRSDSMRSALRLALQVGVFLAAGTILGIARNTPRRALADGLTFGATIGALLVLCDLLWPDWATQGGTPRLGAGSFPQANTAALYFEIVLLVAIAGAASAAERNSLEPDYGGRFRSLRRGWSFLDLRLVGAWILALGVFATTSRTAALAMTLLLVGLTWMSRRWATLQYLRVPAGSSAALLLVALGISALGMNGLSESSASSSSAIQGTVEAKTTGDRAGAAASVASDAHWAAVLSTWAKRPLVAVVSVVFGIFCLRRVRTGLRRSLRAEAGSRRALWLVGGFGAFVVAVLHGALEGGLGHHAVSLALAMSLALALSAAGDEAQQGHPAQVDAAQVRPLP